MPVRNKCLLKIVCAIIVCFALLPYNSTFADSGISTCAYYDDGSFTFTGSKTIIRDYDSSYMALEFNATSSTGIAEAITIRIYVANTKQAVTHTVYSNGETYKIDYVSLGSLNGSTVKMTFSCSNPSAQIQANLVSYSW